VCVAATIRLVREKPCPTHTPSSAQRTPGPMSPQRCVEKSVSLEIPTLPAARHHHELRRMNAYGVLGAYLPVSGNHRREHRRVALSGQMQP